MKKKGFVVARGMARGRHRYVLRRRLPRLFFVRREMKARNVISAALLFSHALGFALLFTVTLGTTLSGYGVEPEARYSLSGRVMDAEGNGLEEVSVVVVDTAEAKHDITDSQGSYSISGIPAGSYQIEVNSHWFVTFPDMSLRGVQSDFEAVVEPLTLDRDMKKDFVLPRRSFRIVRFNFGTGETSDLTAGQPLKINDNILVGLPNGHLLLQDAATYSIIEWDPTSGVTVQLVDGAQIGESLYRIVERSGEYFYATIDEKVLSVRSFALNGRVRELARTPVTPTDGLVTGGQPLALTPDRLIIPVVEFRGGFFGGLFAEYFLTLYAYDFGSGNISKLIDKTKSPVGIKRFPFLTDDRSGRVLIIPTYNFEGVGGAPWVIVRVDGDSYTPVWQAPEGHLMESVFTVGVLGDVVFLLTVTEENRVIRINFAANTVEERDFPFETSDVGVWVESASTLLAVVGPVSPPSSVEPQGKQPVLWGRIRQNALLQNFPNPFNPDTWIPYQLASAAEVTIRIYDVRGRLVRQLNFGKQPAGFYLNRERAAYWDGRGEHGEMMSSGVYFYQFEAGDFTAVRKLVIVK